MLSTGPQRANTEFFLESMRHSAEFWASFRLALDTATSNATFSTWLNLAMWAATLVAWFGHSQVLQFRGTTPKSFSAKTMSRGGVATNQCIIFKWTPHPFCWLTCCRGALQGTPQGPQGSSALRQMTNWGRAVDGNRLPT